MSRETIVEKKCKCDFCGEEIYTNQKTGDPWSGAKIIIYQKLFFGLFRQVESNLDLCKKCYCKLTGKDAKDVGWGHA